MNISKIICLEIVVVILTSITLFHRVVVFHTISSCRSTHHKTLHRLEFCKELGGSECRFPDNH